MRKKILVISHERSGTHFLINTISQCFDYLPNQIDLVNSREVNWRNPELAGNWMRQFKGRFVPNVFKSHHAHVLLSPLLPELLDEFIVFYIQRDGRDAMTSFWTYLNRLARNWGPKCRTVGEFMRATARGGITQYQAAQQDITMLQRWRQHVEGWSQTGLPVHRMTFESLHTEYETVVDKLSDIIEQRPVSRVRPTLKSPSSLPWRGQIGTWKEFFTEADQEYFDQNTKPT